MLDKIDLAPIVLFAYNRLWHTQQTLEALSKNKGVEDSILYIYADGPKEEAGESELEKVQEVRKLIRGVNFCKETIIAERDKNLGLADSIVSGVDEVINKHGKIIVLEDDIVTSPGFLDYMNQALQLYEEEHKVMHISGYMFPVRASLPETFFYNNTSCWGWGTWNRAWQHYNDDANELYQKLLQNNEVEKFNASRRFDFLGQLKANITGDLKTWAVKWHTSVYLYRGFCLHPNKSLVNNIGHDGTGMNCGLSSDFFLGELAVKINVEPLELIESAEVVKVMKKFDLYKPSHFLDTKEKVKKLIPAFLKKRIVDVKSTLATRKEVKDFAILHRKYRKYTMIPEEVFIANLMLCREFKHVEGCFVECGVWRGGMSGAAAEILGDKKCFLFDSFEGLPEVKPIDGPAANLWQSDKDNPIFYDNCSAEIKYAHQAMKLASAKEYEIIKGWFSDTLPKYDSREKIAILRLDGDWYDSTMECLINLYPHVQKGGVIIIDDYYMWEGCSKAVHDYISENKLSVKIRQKDSLVCYIIKD